MDDKIIFTKEYISTFDGIGNHFDRDFLKLLATNDTHRIYREQIEDVIKLYPKDKAIQIVNSFRKSENQSCKAIIAELFTYKKLVEVFGSDNISIEEPLDILKGKTPDFNINNEIIFEVFSVFEEPHPIEAEIREMLNKIDTPFCISLNQIFGLPIKKAVSIVDIKEYFLKLFQENKELRGEKKFSYVSNNGISLSGRFFKSEIKGNVVVSIAKNYLPDFNTYRQKLITNIRKRISEKVKKYNRLKDAGIPFVLVIFDYIGHLLSEKYEWDMIFKGDKIKNIESKNEFYKNSVFKKNTNTTLTSVIVNISRKDTFYFFDNPFSQNKLESKIENLIIDKFDRS